MAHSRKTVPISEIAPGLMHLGRSFWPEIRRQKRLISLSLVSLFLAIIGRVLEPWPIKFMFDWVIIPPDGETDAQVIPPPEFLGEGGVLLASLALALVLFTVLRATSDYFARVGMALSATRIVTDIRARMFNHLQCLSLNYHDQAKSGDLVTRFTYDVERLRDTSVTAMLPLIANVLTIVAMLGVMFWFDWTLAAIPIAVLPIFFMSTLRTTQSVRTVVREQRKRDGALAAATAEVIGAIKYVQALSLGSLQEKVFARQNKKSLQQGARAQRLAAGLERRVDIMLAVATALVLWRGVHLVMVGEMTAGTLILFITYLKFVFRPIRQTAKYLTQVARATASGERILEILETEPEITDQPSAIEAETFEGRLRFNNVSFAYNQRDKALIDINFDIEPGERVAIVGPSGSGKSTILALLLRLYDPANGTIQIDDHDIREYRVDSMRGQIAMVLQDSVLFAVSIRDNIAYGNLDAAPEMVEAAARLANAHDFIMELPQGYDTVIGERGATLSGGQQQRIAIARAVIREAPIMILDEPTVGLDNVSREMVVDALEHCTHGKTTLLVTHDLLASRNYDRILVIRNQRIEESGSHDELMRQHGFYRELFLKQDRENLAQSSSTPVLKDATKR